ncbi:MULTISPECIES: ABC transporter permease subunit [unclassified Actinomyces]|uniref:sugar ABC transporter permease n=1 Tax=unclassified Actinomyces TaxID=2609248 RepID=UPI002016BD1C|nr:MULTISPECIES: ABC transporter permease subunit [unclassified Actinomyces]MCL3777867.1 ABC transporter permease subunit [Actinomyces sp. AC-20-1]MCL3789252.1 ABC transporter permease subunit [Actinomyces sp. 187325]MCL3791605.1 ABC transporter permease subunit [Actinomyces sp. 186855]MCL3793547.1 ABC transporter permease subunit [Actinomyces sp. 217892]
MAQTTAALAATPAGLDDVGGAAHSTGRTAHVVGQPRAPRAVRLVNTIVLTTFLCLVALIVLWPVVHMVAAAFTPGQSISNMPVVPFSAGLTTEHFTYVFTQTQYPRWFLNTLVIALLTTAGTMVLASMGAYVFSRFTFTFKRPFLMSLLVLNVFPSFVGMVAIYVVLLRIGALDTLWGLVLVYLAGNLPYTTWMVKSYMDNIPRSLDEAARLDGASSLRVYWTIILPVARPILVFLGITSFTQPWMDFIFPKMVLRSPENQTIALGLMSFVSDKNNFFTSFAAGAMVVAIPFVIFFVLTQKMLVSSLAGAAVKE